MEQILHSGPRGDVNINDSLENNLRLKWETSLEAAVELIHIFGECTLLTTDPNVIAMQLNDRNRSFSAIL